MDFSEGCGDANYREEEIESWNAAMKKKANRDEDRRKASSANGNKKEMNEWAERKLL
jgi:hypothetical protein